MSKKKEVVIPVSLFSNPVMLSLSKGLDAGALRQRVIANNIANIDTPGYKKSFVTFEGLLKNVLKNDAAGMVTTHPKHFGGVSSLTELKPGVHRNNATSMRTDGNNVDIDEEMVNLAANGIKYQATSRQVSDRISLLTYVVTGGRR